MRAGSAREGRSGRRWLLAGFAAAVSCIASEPAQALRLISVQGSQPERFGRIVLTFDAPVAVKARISNSVLVISYAERAEGGSEKIAAGMPDYVTAARRDPDGTGLRLALQRNFRLNVQPAGEQVFIDLLPENWTGLPPALPPDTIAELAARAQKAEAALKAALLPPVLKPLHLDIATLPTLTRLSLRLPAGTVSSAEPAGGGTRVTVQGNWRIDESETRGRLKPAIRSVKTETGLESAVLTVVPADGYAVAFERDEDGVILDVATMKPPPTEADAGDEAPPAVPPSSPQPAPAPVPARPRQASAPREVAPPREAGDGLVLRFGKPTPAALFERAGVATLVLDADEPPRVEAGASALQPLGKPMRTGQALVYRFAVPAGKLIDLLPVGEPANPSAWELTAGESPAASDSLAISRLATKGQPTGIAVAMAEPGAATWLDLDGDRIAVVTTRGGRPAGIAKRQRFVDFELLPTRIGLAVLAQADDLLVRPGLDNVTIGREEGLAVSGVSRPVEAAVGETSGLAIDRAAWDAARAGDPRATIRRLADTNFDAPKPLWGTTRVALARGLLALGLDPEALGVLEAAVADDASLVDDRDVALLNAIAASRLGREKDALRILEAPNLAADAEAGLWRGLIHAQGARWVKADAAFRGGASVLDRYPKDLQGLLRTSAAETAVETGDLEGAARQIAAITAGAVDPLTRDRVALMRARVQEATNQKPVALASYERLAAEAEQPVAIAADLRGTMLAQTLGTLATAQAIEKLELMAMIWHGGETENEITAGLARLYADAGRWRDSFLMTRRANATAPDAPLSRALHQAAQNMFDDLYLGERAKKLPGIDAVALYFDFKDFAPVGRRGDEIVRHLTDHLIALDLLDSAAELLQYQIEKRLTGPARTAVATRLAAIRLMERQPMQCLQVLDQTYLPDLPGELRRARLLLRARAFSDLSRTDAALETIEDETGPEIERLRADMLWGARRWRQAGEAHEALLGEVWRAGRPLDEAARADVIRAAVAYGLSNETLGLERLKAKFANAMAESPDARAFALLTGPNAVRNPGFRQIAQRATSAETLGAFLTEYRKRYPDLGVPARGQKDAPPPTADTRAETPQDAPPG